MEREITYTQLYLLQEMFLQQVKEQNIVFSDEEQETLCFDDFIEQYVIIAEAFRYGLDPTDEKQRRMATAYLLEKVSWTGMSEFKAGLTASRTRQLCDAMTVTKDLMANLLLAAGGRGGISLGGGGSNGELTNWDGTKKKTGWGR